MSEQISNEELEKKIVNALDKINEKLFKMKEQEFYLTLYFMLEIIPALFILIGLAFAIEGFMITSAALIDRGFTYIVFGALFAYLILKFERRLEKHGKIKGGVVFRSFGFKKNRAN